MKRTIRVLLLVAAAGAASSCDLQSAPASESDGIVGVWQRTMLHSNNGTPVQPPFGAANLIFTEDGYYMQAGMPSGRPVIEKPVNELTREELIQRYNFIEARFGIYRAEHNILYRTDSINVYPDWEGQEIAQRYRVEDETLIFSTPDGTDTAWFVRMP